MEIVMPTFECLVAIVIRIISSLAFDMLAEFLVLLFLFFFYEMDGFSIIQHQSHKESCCLFYFPIEVTLISPAGITTCQM